MGASLSGFTARPLTPETWADLEALFALPGGSIVRGCWCMYYRRSGKVSVSAAAGETNKEQLCSLVDSGVVPGLVGYLDGSPVGWISLGPRPSYEKLRRSRIMKPVDDLPVWSVVCTYVAKTHRGRGLQHALLEAAIDYARDEGVQTLEAYPVDKPERSHDDFMFFGSSSLYEAAGFTEVVRRSPTRVVMRKELTTRAARVQDVHDTALALPHVTVWESGERPIYQVGGKSFVFFRSRRPDAFDPETGERYDDVIVFWVADEGEKAALVEDPATPYFSTPHFDGHPSVLLCGARIGELTRDEVVELVQDAWLCRASSTRARKWLESLDPADPRFVVPSKLHGDRLVQRMRGRATTGKTTDELMKLLRDE